MPYGYSAPVVPWQQAYSAPIFSATPTFNYPNMSAPASTVPAIGPNPATTVPANTNPGALPGPASNVADLPDIIALTKAIDALNLQAQQNANMSRIPGEQGLEQQSSDLIKQQLAGEVPADVRNLLQQQGAESNVVSGRDTNAAYLRALGLTSLGQEQAGQGNLSAAVARNPVAPIFDPSSQLITPYQQGMLNIDQAQLALEAQRLAQARATGGGGGGQGYYGGTGGTAQGPNPNLGNLLFPTITQPSPDSGWSPTMDMTGFDPNDPSTWLTPFEGDMSLPTDLQSTPPEMMPFNPDLPYTNPDVFNPQPSEFDYAAFYGA